ncbi:hypothetical protein ZIOFF_045293 [Zingiber officinale]|uniref:Protein kinase domain-containing protein n=1 Tax=Zingiber officinale TaxID=94328 RepID=A0A8J5KV53_ZINOF|nr:hypothetical protein ZIOFF_045293 [Zingiber officinale]
MIYVRNKVNWDKFPQTFCYHSHQCVEFSWHPQHYWAASASSIAEGISRVVLVLEGLEALDEDLVALAFVPVVVLLLPILGLMLLQALLVLRVVGPIALAGGLVRSELLPYNNRDANLTTFVVSDAFLLGHVSMKCFHSHGDEGAGGVFDDGGSRASRFSWIRSFSTASASSLLGFEPRPTGSEHDPAWELPRLAVWPPEGLRSFSFSELKAATRGFNRSLLLGEGGFGSVYKGDLTITGDHGVAETMEVAVKQLNRHGLQKMTLLDSPNLLALSFVANLKVSLLREMGHNEWVTEVKFLGVVKHPNLVKLVGYCAEDDERGIQRLLVYELMHNKSLEFHLLSRVSTALSWVLRLKIAQDAARGLAFLHEEMDFQLIFRDFKTSNILLDDDFNAKLSDFGFARHGPAEGVGHVLTSVSMTLIICIHLKFLVVNLAAITCNLFHCAGHDNSNLLLLFTQVVGTVGYAAPEYVQTGKLTTKSDVWSYGVFLYELLTGRKSVDWNLPKSEQRLLEWVKPFATNPRKLQAIIDPRLDGNYCSKSVLMVVALANRCLKKQPKSRPRMSEVVERLDQIIKMCTSQTTNAILSPSLSPSPSPSPSPSSGDAISDRTKWPEDKGSRTRPIEFKHITRPLAKMTKAWG